MSDAYTASVTGPRALSEYEIVVAKRNALVLECELFDRVRALLPVQAHERAASNPAAPTPTPSHSRTRSIRDHDAHIDYDRRRLQASPVTGHGRAWRR